MVRKIFLSLVVMTMFLFTGCNYFGGDNSSQIANPASVFCQEKGGDVDIRSGPDGEYGVCVFENFECDEWEYYEGQCNEETYNLSKSCDDLNGKWISKAQECEGISNENCLDLGGNFNECASNCRNDPDAEICSLQCVQVCEFTHQVKICTKEYSPVCGIDNVTYSNSCLAGDVGIQYLGKCFNDEDKLDCETNGGKYEQLGMGRIWQCNMPTVDAWQSCNDISECQGTCLAQDDMGYCSEWTRNFGCISIMKNGDPVEICVD